MTSHPEPIRNAELSAALNLAGKGQYGALYEVLSRLSGLPGPRPNVGLAEAVGAHLAAAGPSADRIVSALAKPAAQAATSPTGTFLPMCAAMAFAYQYLAGQSRALAALEGLADDERREVRDGVVRALLVIGRGRPVELVDAIEGWMATFMPAAVAVEAIADRSVVGGVSRADAILARFAQGFERIVDAARSDERSQGYRLLMRSLAELTSALAARFPERTTQWFDERLTEGQGRVRLCIERLLEQTPKGSASRRAMHAIEQRMGATAPAPRDPRTVVGPTRHRGKR